MLQRAVVLCLLVVPPWLASAAVHAGGLSVSLC